MRLRAALLGFVSVAVIAISCAPRGTSGPRTDPATISRDQLLTGRFSSVYDAVQALHSNWLVTRGADSFIAPSVIWVYLDNTKLGDISTLRAVQPATIEYVRHLSGPDATARWGVGHGAGVIFLSTFKVNPTGRDTALTPARHAGALAWSGSGNSIVDAIQLAPVAKATTDLPSANNDDVLDMSRTASPYVSHDARADRFPLSEHGKAATIVVSENDYAGVRRVAHDLSADVGRVTGSAAPVSNAPPSEEAQVVLVGTVGHSTVIDALVRSKKLDVQGIVGKWESSMTQTVDNPMPGVSRALVIAGSDKRGTIYGAYELSSAIGVSPWYWWADVPVPHQNNIYVASERRTLNEPAVKYRGIFINDEAPAFSGWTREKFGGVNHVMYEKMFELILRMKGNYLWPAMWGNAFADDDSLNAKRADEYGIVMGTSHHEPLTRAQQEWKRYGHGEWNYEKNDATLREFWRAGVERMGTRENIVTVGMRGDGDMPMTEGSNIALLEKIVADQRTIISDVTGKPAAATPQMWALYKEVQDYYDRGMRVPDDVTLLFSDDNWGNIRRLPGLEDRARAGGFGIYYHFDYVGGPRNYKWLNTNPIARVWEQLHLANAYGANRIWVVNVGDLKPMEFPIQFFLDYAWNPSAIPASTLPQYTTQWVAQQFGSTHAADIAEIITTYLKYNGRRKPELLEPDTYSLTNFGEAERVVSDYNALVERVNVLAVNMPAPYKDAFYELVQHPVQASANIHELYFTVAQNRLYASQGRAATNDLAEKARMLFDRDADISKFYNTQLAGGKWNHMMDQTHIGYTYWQEPPRNVMPRVDVIQLPEAADMGVAVVEQDKVTPQYGRSGASPPSLVPGAGRGGPALPPFDAYNRQTYHVDVYNKGQTSFTFKASANEPWLRVMPASGTVTKQQRLSVNVDWSRAPSGISRAPITIAGAGGTPVVIQVTVHNPIAPRREDVIGFVESNGYVSMEAEHFTRATSGASSPTGSAIHWERIPDLGRTLSGVMAAPVTSPSLVPTTTSPHLEYTMRLTDSGAVKVHAYFSPTQNFSAASHGIRYGISLDDETPQIINIIPDTSNAAWEKAVADNIRVLESQHHVVSAGEHVLKYWYVDPGVVLQKLVVETTNMPNSYLGPPESFYRPARSNSSPASRRPE